MQTDTREDQKFFRSAYCKSDLYSYNHTSALPSSGCFPAHRPDNPGGMALGSHSLTNPEPQDNNRLYLRIRQCPYPNSSGYSSGYNRRTSLSASKTHFFFPDPFLHFVKAYFLRFVKHDLQKKRSNRPHRLFIVL